MVLHRELGNSIDELNEAILKVGGRESLLNDLDMEDISVGATI